MSGEVVSTFPGAENPLSEGGLWVRPGSWSDIRKNDGAYTEGTNGSVVATTLIGPAQYAQIEYDIDTGADGVWVGVVTRSQYGSGGLGSCYLSIVYANTVRLYRADNTGALAFTELATAGVSSGDAPRRLRMESEGHVHRVYFNDTLEITYDDSGFGGAFAAGHIGCAASEFGGPLVKIIAYEGGNLDEEPESSSDEPSSSETPVSSSDSDTPGGPTIDDLETVPLAPYGALAVYGNGTQLYILNKYTPGG